MNAAELFEVETDSLFVNSIHQEVDEHLKIYFLIQIWFHAGRDRNFFERIKTYACVSSWCNFMTVGCAILTLSGLSLVTLSCFPGLEPLLQYSQFSKKFLHLTDMILAWYRLIGSPRQLPPLLYLFHFDFDSISFALFIPELIEVL